MQSERWIWPAVPGLPHHGPGTELPGIRQRARGLENQRHDVFVVRLVRGRSQQRAWVGSPESQWSVVPQLRSEEHTSELQSLMRISYHVFCLKHKNTHHETNINN